jgi:hypothetical protein
MDKFKNKHYHSIKKGCVIIEKPTLSKEIKRLGECYPMKTKYCNTHKKVICRCGWEFNFHPEFKDYT